jgi:hypothetical protein
MASKNNTGPDFLPSHFTSNQFSRVKVVLYILLLPGLVLFIHGALVVGDLRIWQIYLVNLLFWSGFSQAGVVVSALLNVTNGKWGKDLRHIMEGLTFFSPVAFLLFLVLFLGRDQIFTWIAEPVPEKGGWLDIMHLFVRETFNLIILNILNGVYCYHSFRPLAGGTIEKTGMRPNRFLRTITAGWRGIEKEKEASERALKKLSPVILLAYVIVYSMIAFDFVMSLDPYWYSTLFGVYFFIMNLYMGLAGITIIAVIFSFSSRVGRYITKSQLADLGTLIFVFCMIALDFFWSQYLVIWYGNIPEEISFLVERINEPKWRPFTLTVLVVCFVLPFVLLLGRELKRKRRFLLPVACLVFASVWLERYVLVVPTLWHQESTAFGVPEVILTLSFLSGFILMYIFFLERFPVLPLDELPVS